MTKAPSDRRIAEKVFEKWKSELIDKPKGKDSLYSNFDDIFFELSRNMIASETAHSFINLAVAAHLPDKYIVTRTYNASLSKKDQTREEFFEGWKTLILGRATQAFYDNFPLREETVSAADKIQLPRGMSKQEYRLQRKHAQEYPLLDLAAIADMYKGIENEEVVSFEDIVGNLDGEDKSRNDK